jgi:hypothetical protein
MRFFNTSGPCDPRRHYMLPALARLPEAPRLIERGAYFVVHAPRQTGKTTVVKALAGELTRSGRYAALRFSCESAMSADDDPVAAQRAILRSMARRAARELPAELRPPQPWPEYDRASVLADGLLAWAHSCPRPLVLIFDEIDTLHGYSLRSMLHQLRDNYDLRPEDAPWSVVLCGMRDVRDYKAASGGDASRLGTSSPFNIKAASLLLGTFTAEEVRSLYAQHTGDTGQVFMDDAAGKAFELTAGQPWLVNALAAEIIDEMNIAPPEPITAAHMEEAKQRLILARATHLDSLVARLQEPRVRRIIEPLMAGTLEGGDSYDDDFAYVRDLGLIAPGSPTRIANPIYREVIARVLAAGIEHRIVPPRRFVLPDGRLDMDALLRAFAEFWREHGEILTSDLSYQEVAPQLVLMAFLQRIVNGGGTIEREYGVGRGRIDLLVRWPCSDEAGHEQVQREAFELKVWAEKKPDPRDKGLEQLDAYLERLGLDHGVLVIFDRRKSAPPWAERSAFEQATTPTGRAVTILRA